MLWKCLNQITFFFIFLELKSPDTGINDSFVRCNFTVSTCYLPLTENDSATHMQGIEVYVKEGLPFAPDLSLENSENSYLRF